MRTVDQWPAELRDRAEPLAQVAMETIEQEFPYAYHRVMAGPGDFPSRPRDRTPIFFGSYDWHSSVAMHWALVRLIRVAPDAIPLTAVKAVLDRHFTPEAVACEIDFITHPDSLLRERPYGWAWTLMLVSELSEADDADLRRWSRTLAPLADAVSENFLRWLPNATYPVRHGVHGNSAFGIVRALDFARARACEGRPQLIEALLETARRWYSNDPPYLGGWEPSGIDSLSPTLCESDLMSKVLERAEYLRWLERFLPRLAQQEPAELFDPPVVSTSSDGYIAHLHGLNATRAWCWRRLAASLPDGDPRIAVATAAAERHAEAFLPYVLDEEYHTRHWLAAYAVLMLDS